MADCVSKEKLTVKHEKKMREINREINPNRKAKTPHLEDNLVIIKNPKGTRVCL